MNRCVAVVTKWVIEVARRQFEPTKVSCITYMSLTVIGQLIFLHKYLKSSFHTDVVHFEIIIAA